MPSKTYTVWKNSWKDSILKHLSHAPLTWKEIRTKTKLSGYAVNKALTELLQSNIVRKDNIDGINYYKVVGDYSVVEQTKSFQKKDISKEEELNLLLSKIEMKTEKKDHFEAIYETDLRDRYYGLIKEAKESIIIVTPYLQECTVLRDLEKKVAKVRNFILVTRKSDNVYERNKKEQQRWIEKFENKNSEVITHRNIHAKILIAEKKKCIISSMNLTKDSISKNREFGIYTDSIDIINSALEFIQDMYEET